MSDPVADILSKLEAEQDAETRFLAELVKVPSDNPPGDCQAHAERVAALLEGLGFEVERHPVPRDTVEAAGMISATNLVVRRRFGDGPVIALNAHGDVVPPGEGWTRDPYGAEIADGWMYGRGVAVSKSDIATYTYALIALDAAVKAGAKLNGTVELHFTYDEEAGGEIFTLRGRIMNDAGTPRVGHRIEIWQCDMDGNYMHPRDARSVNFDRAFQGFGHDITDETGGYVFRTIKPTIYPGRAPHIHVKLFDGDRELLTTQFYIKDDPNNIRDGLFARMSEAEADAVSMVFVEGDHGTEATVDVVV